MKKLVILVTTIFLMSCMSDDRYEDYNIDPNNPSEVTADFLFNSALKSLVDLRSSDVFHFNRLLAQYWATTTYPDLANYITDLSRPSDYFWGSNNINILLDLKTSKDIITNDNVLTEGQKKTSIAQIEVLMVYTWQLLVDTFGNIPYSEALDLDLYTLPKYDDAATIYQDLIQRIDIAISNLNDQGLEIDNLYFGDIDSWRTFANSLKLRLGIRLTDINPELSKTTVESAFNAGVFSSNVDNAILNYPGGANSNPVWYDLVLSGRKDYVGANTIIDIMNDLNDPRRGVYFQENLGPGIFDGGIYGAVNTYSLYSQVGSKLQEPDFPGTLMDFAEVSFYLAEAAEQGYIVGNAETHYNNGIIASFDYWGVGDVASYLANPDVAYTTATGDWKTKIGTQFWLAMYNRGFEGWTVWRKYDVPTFNLPALTNNPVPNRYEYPINEQNLNQTNWESASQAIGGDLQTTKIFWDVN